VPTLLGAKRPPVRGTVNGAPFRLDRRRPRRPVPARAQQGDSEAAGGVRAGDTVSVALERDDEPRTVELPDDLRGALDNDLRAFFDSLSREYVRWIEEAKRDETRRRRVDQAVSMLRERVRTPDA
jgi:Bacteriocin-protection, YdeI or OmpD-Associated